MGKIILDGYQVELQVVRISDSEVVSEAVLGWFKRENKAVM